MRIFNLFLFMFLLTSCSSSLESQPHIVAADKITKPFIANAKKNHGVSVLGTGGKMTKGQVEDMSVSFITVRMMNIDQARVHFLSIVSPLVNEIEKSNELKPYLKNPNNPENAALISITYRDKEGHEPKRPYIAHVMMVKGRVCYSVSDSPGLAYRTIHRETYQEALSKTRFKAYQ